VALSTVTVQVVEVPSETPSVQGEPVIVSPLGEASSETVPAGAEGSLPVSVTVSVQVLSFPVEPGDGLHDTSVAVGLATVTVPSPLLVVCALVGMYVPVTSSVPSTEFEYVNVQVATPVLAWASVHAAPTVPDAADPPTAPVGVTAVPPETVSVTVAVQVLVVWCWTVEGEHTTVVDVGWAATSRVVVPWLVPCPSAAV
jgi:hypothetical protein